MKLIKQIWTDVRSEPRYYGVLYAAQAVGLGIIIYLVVKA